MATLLLFGPTNILNLKHPKTKWLLYLNGVRMAEQELQSWQVQYKCKLCSFIVYSKFANHTSRCECGAIAVEQAPYMNYKSGKEENFIDPNQVDEEEEDIFISPDYDFGYGDWC